MGDENKHEISQKSLGRAISSLVILILLFLGFSPLTKSFALLGKGLFYLFGLVGPYFLLPTALAYGVISLFLGAFPKKRGVRTLIGLFIIFLALSALSSHIGFKGKESLDYSLFASTYKSLSPVECFYSPSIGGGVIGYYLSSLASLGGLIWLYAILAISLLASFVIIFFPEIKKLFMHLKSKRLISNSKKKEAEKAKSLESIAKATEAREAANKPIYSSTQAPFSATPVTSSPLKESTFVSSVPLPPPFVSTAPKKVISEDEEPLPSRLDLYGDKIKSPLPTDITDESTRRHTPTTPATYFYESGLQEAKFNPSAKAKELTEATIETKKEEPKVVETKTEAKEEPALNLRGLFMNETPLEKKEPSPKAIPLFMDETEAKEEINGEMKEASIEHIEETKPLAPRNGDINVIQTAQTPVASFTPNAAQTVDNAIASPKEEEPVVKEAPQPLETSVTPMVSLKEEPVDTIDINEEDIVEPSLSVPQASSIPDSIEAKPAEPITSDTEKTVTKEETNKALIEPAISSKPLEDEKPLEEEEPVTAPVVVVAPKVDPDAQPEAKELPPYTLPSIDLLKDYPSANEHKAEQIAECEARKDLINQIFDGFKAGAHVVNYTVGPSVTRYNILTDTNVTVSSINRYIQDISVRLGGVATRYEEIVMGQSYSGLEIANKITTMVSLKDTIKRLPVLSPKTNLVVPFGESISGDYIASDLSEFPHMLISGSTGSGKSVFMHGLIMSLIMRNRPEDLKLVMVDPKRVEMGCYKDIPHLLCPIIKEPSQAKVCFQKLIAEMERRYGLFDKSGVRNIREFNGEYATEHHLTKLPFIVVIVDEFADLADSCKDIGEYVVRIAQKARAAGIHLVIATQRPTVDVITGTIKANLACRVALSVASAQDSITILGQGGAEELAGHGDMLVDCSQVLRNGFIRCQGCYVDTHEINNVTNFIRSEMGPQYDSRFLDLVDHEEEEAKAAEIAEANAPSKAELRAAQGDDFYEMVKETIMSREYTSISRIQREFGVGFPRAGKIFARLQSDGIVAQDPDTASSSKGCRVIKHSDASSSNNGGSEG